MQSFPAYIFIFQSIFTGFGIFSIIYLLVKEFVNSEGKTILLHIDQSATLLVRFAGVLGIVLGLISFSNAIMLLEAFDDGEYESYAQLNRMFGPYWYVYWGMGFFYPSITQLLWVKKIREIKWVRVLLSLLLVLSLEKIVIIVSSLHRDYLPSSWQYNTPVLAWGYVLKFCTFMLILGIAHFLRGLKRPAHEQIS